MFTGRIFKQNRIISISARLIEFWCFGLPAALGVGGGCMGVGMAGGAPTHVHMHACTHTHIYTLNMIISIANGSPHWGNPWEFPMMSYTHVCACTCMCTCVRGTLSLALTPSTHPPPHQGGTPEISQNSIALELIEIFQFCLKI